MKKLQIICVDDQPEVGASVVKNLEELNNYIELINCTSAAEAEIILDELDTTGALIALIISDQIMPEKNGVDFLAEITEDPRFFKTQTILLTGQASHEDTIRAINEVQVNAYIAKPWTQEELINKVKKSLALYLIKANIDYEAYLPALDQDTIYKDLHK